MYKFSDWTNIFEATLNDSKEGIVYTLSRTGAEKIRRVFPTITTYLDFTPTQVDLDDNDPVIHIKSSSFQATTFGEFKDYYRDRGLEVTRDNFFMYDTTSKVFPYACAVKGLETTMIKQKFRKAGSARGDYFRETAFIITLACRLWHIHKIKVKVVTNRGQIPMVFNSDEEFTAYPNPRRAELRNKYSEFMEKKWIGEAMTTQCDQLISALGESAKTIALLKKNNSEMVLNKFFRTVLKREREKIKQNMSEYHFIPENLVLSKWNPSDMWIGFDEHSWMLQDGDASEEKFAQIGINNLDDLNTFLHNCIVNKNGVIGVSLKQQIEGAGKIYKVNVQSSDVQKFKHYYQEYKAKATNKYVQLIFAFDLQKIGSFIKARTKDLPKSIKGKGTIDIRTFDTKPNSPISIEVKGSKSSEHMSGKAGSYIKYVMPPEDYALLNYIQKEENPEKIGEYVLSNYNFTRPDLEKIFIDDTKKPKTGSSNSRMQAVFFTDWLESLEDLELQDEIVSDIIRFAKSESNWSAPHLIVK